MLLEFPSVPLFERVPFRRVVPEPFSEAGARRQILEPGVDLELALDDAPWPDTVDQNAITIARRGRVIGAFQIDRQTLLHFGAAHSVQHPVTKQTVRNREIEAKRVLS